MTPISLFEFVLTGFTLVLALVITRILGALRWVFAMDRAYWVHGLFVLSMLVLTSLVWWGLWYQRDADWNYLSFAYNLLIGPGVIYYITVLLVPDTPRRIRDWRAYFESVRVLLYSAFLGLTVAMFIGGIAITGTSITHPSQIFIAIAFFLSIAGLASRKHWLHGALAVALALLVAGSAVLAAQSQDL